MEFRKGETSFAKLTRAGDFDTWQFRMQLYLKGIGVYSIVDGSEDVVSNPRAPTALPANTAPDTPATTTGTAATPVVRAPVDKNALKEWREYRFRCDIAVSSILQGLSDELAKRYRSPDLMSDPAALWTRIENDSKSKLKLDVHHLRTQLTEIRLEECGSVDAYVDRFQQVCDQIALAGKTIADGERYFYMLQGLPVEWENYKDMMGMHIGDTDK